MLGEWFNSQIAQTLLRNAAQWSGSALAANGWLTGDQTSLWSGAIVSIGTLAFSIVSARFKSHAIDVAGGKANVKRVVETKSLMGD